jgi:PAS domain S-box-containing protein
MDQPVMPQTPLELEALQARLEEVEETLRAIRSGEVDALVVSTSQGAQVYTLKGAEEPYRVVVEAMGEGAVTLGSNGIILYCNHRFAELVKARHEQIISQPVHAWVVESEREKLGQMLEQGSAAMVRGEFTLRATDGTLVPAYFSMRSLPEGAGMGIAAVITDLTELKQAQKKTDERAKELQELFTISELAQRQDIGLDRLYQEVANALPKGWRYPEIACARVVMADSEFHTDNFKVTPWMLTAPVRVHGAAVGKIDVGYLEKKPELDEGPFVREERQMLNAIAERVGRITEQKRAEEELSRHHLHLEHMVEQRTSQFEAVSMELEGFAYSVSHDLRVPLRAIDGFSKILLKEYEGKLDDEGKRYLNLVRENTNKLNLMFDKILALSRMGRQRMTFSEIDMEQLARAAFEELKPAFAGRELTFDVKPLPRCHGDLTMLRQVWASLLDNAIKFTRQKPAATIEVGGRTEGSELIYYVKDNGAGFDMQYADKLFSLFQRLHSVEEFEGAGFGLAIVKRIVTRHGGRVWAEGKVNEGATFYFALPIAEEGKT